MQVLYDVQLRNDKSFLFFFVFFVLFDLVSFMSVV